MMFQPRPLNEGQAIVFGGRDLRRGMAPFFTSLLD